MIGDAYADILEEPIEAFDLDNNNNQKMFSEPEEEEGMRDFQKIEQKYLENPEKALDDNEKSLDATIRKPLLDSQLKLKSN